MFFLQPYYSFSQTSEEIEALNKKIEQTFRKNPTTTKENLQLLLKYKILHDTTRASAYGKLGISYIQMAEYDSAFASFQQGIEKSVKYPTLKAKLLTNLAIAHRSSSDYEKSLTILSEALEIYEDLKNQTGIAIIYGEMASNYNYMLEDEQAVKYLQQGIDILEKEGSSRELTVLKQKLANSYFNNGNFEFARDMYKDVLPFFKENSSSNYYYTLLNYGDCLYYLDDYVGANESYKIAEKGLQSLNNEEFAFFAMSKQGRVYVEQKDDKKALQVYEKAFNGLYKKESVRLTQVVCEYLEVLNNNNEFATALSVVKRYKELSEKNSKAIHQNFRDELEFLKQSNRAYKGSGLLAEALTTSERINELKDSVAVARNEQEIAEIQEKYQNQIQKEQNEALLKNIGLLNNNLEKKNRIILLTVLVVVLLLSSTYFFFNKMKYKDRLKKLSIENLNVQKKIAEDKHKAEELKRMEKEQLVEAKQREIVASTMEFANLQNNIKSLLNDELPQKDFPLFRKRLLTLLEEKNYWKEFQTRFTEVHPDFFEKCKESYPALTKNDLQFCSLLKIGLNNKEIATLLGISHQSVITRKYRIRKKLELDEETELEALFQ